MPEKHLPINGSMNIDELFSLPGISDLEYGSLRNGLTARPWPIRQLVRSGAHGCPEEEGITPLHQAAYNGSCKKMRNLIKKGVDVNATDIHGWTPLHDAVMEGHTRVVRMLIAAGANVNAQDIEEQYSPLHEAMRMKHREIAKILLAANADTSLKNSENDTAFETFKRYHFR